MSLTNNPNILIQARLSSSRLPAKVLLPFGNQTTLLGFLFKRLKYFYNSHSIYLATSTNQEDDLICDECEKHSIPFYRGSLSNVYKRLFAAADFFSLPSFIRITADDPFIDPIASINPLLDYSISSRLKFCTSFMVEPTPNGQVCSFFNTEYLSSFSAVDDPQFKEHLVPYLISLSSNKSLFSPHIGNNVLPLSLAVDTESNYKALFNPPRNFLMTSVFIN